jgi:hypothetical protein
MPGTSNRQRRIKCDEKRPSCTQCVRSKKICTGYPPPSRSARSHEVLAIAPKPNPVVEIQARPLVPITQARELPARRQKKIVQRLHTPPDTPVTNPSSMTLYRPSLHLPMQQQEGLYFQLFRTHTANELSGYFDSVFWTRTVLQECHSEAAIRHAVVALGALYKTLEKSSESPPSSPSDVSNPMDGAYRHWEVAVKQYSDACQALFLLNNQDQKYNRVRLMSSVLLACFDSFIGDHKQAIKQIQAGLCLLEQLRVERRRAFLPSPEEPVEDELVQMFTRLAIQAKSYDMAFHFPQPYVIKLTPQMPADPASPPSEASSPSSVSASWIPEQFTSLLEARTAWDKLCERMMKFTEMLFNHTSGNGPMGVLPRSLKQYGLGFKNQLESWSDAFEHILESRTAPGVSFQEKAGIAVLKMCQIMGQVLFMMTFSDSESQFDLFQSQFKAIVDFGSEVVGDEERRAAAKRCPDPRFCRHRQNHAPDIFGGHEYAACHIKPSFSADLGIVPPLYVVATKCRNPVIRRQAIQLLTSSARREGMWDSELAARIGHWITAIEEEEDRPPVHSMPDPMAMPATRNGSVELPRDVPLGPGGNARWDVRRDSAIPGLAKFKRTIPEEKRVMVRAVDFDLRARFARLQVGTRGLQQGAPDLRSRETQIAW